MKAARLHEYGKPLVLEDIPVPVIQPDEILVNVKACGMCRSDVQLVDGYFRKYADIPTPITLGHEITGIAHVGSCPKWRDFRRETTWLSRPDGAMASAAIAWSAIRTFVPTCVGPDSDRWEVLQSSSPSRLAIWSRRTVV